MQIGRDNKTYKGNKRDQYTIVLEDIRHQFGLFLRRLADINQHIVELRSDIARMNRKLNSNIEPIVGRLENS